jgi:outer membrane protein OmpA-like peptidoglycan-associated protein
LLLPALVLLGAVSAALANDGKVKIHVVPKQAYVAVDGQLWQEATRRALKLSPGTHTLELFNYGFRPAKQEVSVAAGKTTRIDVKLDPVPGEVTGPWGCLTIEGASRDAVLLNGKTPGYFVGHGDEFNNEWIWKQELVVPAGSHQLTIMKQGKEVWSGQVEVPANQRVVVDIPKGVRKTVPWPRGERLKSVARFKAGKASALVAVVKPTAQITANPTQVACAGPAQLQWSSTESVAAEISGLGPVDASGQRTVQPTADSTYRLTVSGPGGAATASAAVAVNTAVQASLKVQPLELRYQRFADRVTEKGSAALTWSTANASSVSLDPFGTVAPSGTRTLDLVPQTASGPVNETFTYVLKASNVCGGSGTQTVSVHLTGLIRTAAEKKKLEEQLVAQSVYFPTAQPRVQLPEAGLVPSQESYLTQLAVTFKDYLNFEPAARLVLSGHADKRGSRKYNDALSQRRADRARQFLVAQGVLAASIETKSFGKEKNLTPAEVKQLLEQQSDLDAAARKKLLRKLPQVTLAENRRVDVGLSSTGAQSSARTYPFNAADSAELLNVKAAKMPAAKAVHQPKPHAEKGR